jgi:hypothetical protein
MFLTTSLLSLLPLDFLIQANGPNAGLAEINDQISLKLSNRD